MNKLINILMIFSRIGKYEIKINLIKKFVATHPSSQSLDCARDFLLSNNIKAIFRKLSNDNLLLEYNDSTNKLIFAIEAKLGSFALVTKISDGVVNWINSDRKLCYNSINEFSGFIKNNIFIEVFDDTPIIVNNKINLRLIISSNIRNLTYCFLAVVLIGFSIYRKILYHYSLFIILNLIGVAICALILSVQLKGSGSITRRLCYLTKNSNCEAVLFSKYAKLFKLVGWSDLGLIYFISNWIYDSLYGDTIEALSLQYVIAFLACGYVFYSLYSQAYIIRRWCTLCLFVQGLLIVEVVYSALVFGRQGIVINEDSTNYCLRLGIIYLFSSVIYFMLYPSIKAYSYESYTQSITNIFKYDEKVFYNKLLIQKRMPNWLPKYNYTITNDHTRPSVTIVINPFCAACSEVYATMKMLAKSANISLNIVYFTGVETNSIKYILCKELLAIDSTFPLAEVIDHWFNIDRDYDLFEQIYDDTIKKIDHKFWDDKIADHLKWTIEADINYAPVIFFDKSLVPSYYKTRELILLINKLICK